MHESIEAKRMSGAVAEDIANQWLIFKSVTPEAMDALLSHIRWLEESLARFDKLADELEAENARRRGYVLG